MLEISILKENKNDIIERLKKRYIDPTENIDLVISLDDQRKKTKTNLDEVLAESNQIAKQVGDLFKQGKKEEATALRNRAGELKSVSAQLKDKLQVVESDIKEILYKIPNVPHVDVPVGKSDEENEEVYRNDVEVNLYDDNKPHWDLIKQFDIVDFELGVKVTGAGFPFYKGKGARLQRALINFFLDENAKAGYTEYIPPFMINEASGIGTGQLPDKEGQMYHMQEDDLYMIPTSEVPLTNIFRGDLLKENNFPIKMTAYSPCFRREAGSWGSHVRGLNRLHQFEKVEIVRIEHPDKSYEALEEMKKHVGGLLDKLGLPFRLLRLCSGDLGFTSTITFDYEVYSAAQERWLEVSSISNFETFQANRLKLRFKDKEGNSCLAHTLNGSALALPRILAAILENNQTENGIKIPEVLVPYTGFDTIN